MNPVCVIEGPCLYINKQNIENVPSFQNKKHHGKAVVAVIKSIDLSLNQISDIRNIRQFKRLTQLILDYNEISEDSFSDVEVKRLEHLSVAHNKIADLEKFTGFLLCGFPHLRSLNLLSNPCVPNKMVNARLYQSYRMFIISKLPMLAVLDGDPVTQAEIVQIQGRQYEAPLIAPKEQVLSPTEKEELGFSIVIDGALTIVEGIDTENVADVAWRPQYFILGERRLVYYKDQHHAVIALESPVQVFHLADYKLKVPKKKQDQEIFKMVLVPKNADQRLSIYLYTQRERELDDWVYAFGLQFIDFVEEVKETEEFDHSEWHSREEIEAYQAEIQRREATMKLEKVMAGGCQIAKEELELGHELGRGAFGIVYEGRCRSKSVAIKKLMLKSDDLSPQVLADFANEIDIMTKIHHPHIILCLGACFELENLMIVTELMSGDIESLMEDSSRAFTLAQRLNMAKDAALGLNWLHSLEPMIIHRDVKPANFLVDDNMRVVVADFGLSHGFGATAEESSFENDFQGTITYTAPELLLHESYNELSDVYSFALVLWVILTRKTDPFPELTKLSNKDFVLQVCIEDYRPKILAEYNCPQRLHDLMENCWQRDYKKRPNCKSIIITLENVIAHLVIPSAEGRKFWKSNFRDKERVSWSNFIKNFKFILSTDVSQEMDIVLRAMFCGVNLQEDNPQVSMKRFGQMLSYFGPLAPGAEFLERVRYLVFQPWFHGSIGAEEANVKLLEQGPGTYLIRFDDSIEDEEGGWLCLSYINKNNHFKERLFQRKLMSTASGRDFFELKSKNSESARYSSLQEVKALFPQLTRACIGPMSQYLTFKINRVFHSDDSSPNKGAPPRSSNTGRGHSSSHVFHSSGGSIGANPTASNPRANVSTKDFRSTSQVIRSRGY